MKMCAKCKIEKQEDRFSIRKAAKDGLHPYCKECISKIMKVYGKNELVKKRAKDWKKNNSKSVKINAKNDYEKHKEKRLEKVHKYNNENRILINERQRKYYKKNKEQICLKNKIKLSSEQGKLKSNEYYRKIKEKSDHKIKARNNLRYAVYAGNITRPDTCEKCLKKTKVQGHHEDYTKHLEVIWVCSQCHKDIHKKELE